MHLAVEPDLIIMRMDSHRLPAALLIIKAEADLMTETYLLLLAAPTEVVVVVAGAILEEKILPV
jgi:hypothetical protein